MALKKVTAAPVTAAAVEADPTAGQEAQAQEAAAASPPPAPAPSPAPVAAAAAPAKALVVQQARNLVSAKIQEGLSSVEAFKDSLRVDWNTLEPLKANQGNFLLGIGQAAKKLGDWIKFELISFQDNWVVSPGRDGEEARALAKYSDDGKVLKDDPTTTCAEYIAHLNELGCDKAKLSKRVVIVGALIDCDKDVSVPEDLLFQIDLPPTSMANFNRYRAQAAYKIAKDKPLNWTHIKAVAEIATQRGTTNVYTVVSFEQIPEEEMTA